MINLTVKTLDSMNHEFSVEDDITVAQFKERIADQINIPADTQRIIYCGRVLKDELKLNDYDVNGKVVHLVQRAPPTSNQGSARSVSPQPQRTRPITRNLDSIYLGSMHIPANLMNTDYPTPPPTHSLAASRLNVAKRMLRKTESVLNLLENPSTRSDQSPSEEPQEEVTPIFEARLIVPTTSLNEPIDEAYVLSAVQNSIFDNASAPPQNQSQPSTASNMNMTSTSDETSANVEATAEDAEFSSETESPEGTTPTNEAAASTAGASTSSTQDASQSRRNLAENMSPTSEMAELLDQLGRIQIRLAPFLEQYQSFMRQDPVVPQEDVRKQQVFLSRVSEILHFLGHAYHSLSDIIVRVRTPPPRPLLCRPILIPHSAIVQTGIPIQVEAEINFNTEAQSPAASTAQTNSSTTTGNNEQSQTSTTTTENARPSVPPRQPQVLRIPIGAGIHVESIPIPFPIGGISARMGIPTADPPSQASNTSTTMNSSTESNSSNATANDASPSTNGSTNTQPSANRPTIGIPNMFQNNPNVEFIMEVTPEGITIDSLEATLLGANRSGEILRGNLGAPPTDFIQSIMQMAGQIMTRGAQNVTISTASTFSAPPQTSNQTQDSSTAPSTVSQSSQSSASTNQTTGQNSQARGNTSTNPTTATHTRTSSRPHVQLAQHAVQGFDPFLPCNSHHVTNRRRTAVRATSQFTTGQATNARPGGQPAGGLGQGTNNQFNPLYNLVNGVLNSLQNVVRRVETTATPNATGSNVNRNQAGDGNIPMPSGTPFASFIPHLQNMNLSDLNTQLTLAQLFPDEGLTTEGENIISDLIALLARNLTLGDIVQLNNDRLEPLVRIRHELRHFFLARVLSGSATSSNIDRGVNRILSDLDEFTELLGRLNVRNDIDISRSAQMLFRARLPNIISLAASHSPNSLRMFVDQCRITARQLGALILNASATGQQGVEELLESMLTRYMQDYSQEIRQWTLVVSRAHFRRYMTNLSVPDSILQPYIVRRIESVTTPVTENIQALTTNENAEEPMDLDDQVASGSQSEGEIPTLPPLNLNEDPEPLPSVVLGSDGWHGQVPAEWVPLIARDTQRQRRQNQQPAFSDAYLSGMPSKRRKIVTSAKPQGSLPQVITESVRRAVTATGLANVNNLDVVSQAAGSDINIQSAYRDLLRSSVQTNLQDNEDFTPDRFPNATNYFSKSQ